MKEMRLAEGIKSLLGHPKLISENAPASKGGAEHSANNPFAKNHTAFWRMRADYVLPSKTGFKIYRQRCFLACKRRAHV